MLVSAEITKVPSVERLIQLWAERYTPDLFSLTSTQAPWILSELFEVSSPQGRAVTVAKLHEALFDLEYQLTVVQAKSFYDYVADVLDPREISQLTALTVQIYTKLLKLYQQSTSIALSPTDKLHAVISDPSLSDWGIPDVDALAKFLEPMLVELQKQHVASIDWRALGFMTTQLNCINQLLLQRLTPVEQVLINPYFKFIEEQAAIPWQRICAAAAKHQSNSPGLVLVEQMMPASRNIAWMVYHRLLHRFPQHHSRRGRLENREVMHSCLRDLEMFQAYLWLSVLEESLQAVKQELVTLCVMVLESVEIEQALIIQSTQLLMDEVVSSVSPAQKSFLQPYVEGIQQALYIKRRRLGVSRIEL